MNGREVSEEARRKRPDLKVLFTTGYTRNAIVHNGVLDPGVVLLQKPASFQQLSAKSERCSIAIDADFRDSTEMPADGSIQIYGCAIGA
jgi:ActR/RegA family two-component response regulator